MKRKPIQWFVAFGRSVLLGPLYVTRGKTSTQVELNGKCIFTSRQNAIDAAQQMNRGATRAVYVVHALRYDPAPRVVERVWPNQSIVERLAGLA